MRTDERDAQPDQGPKGFGVVTHVVIVIALLALTVIILLQPAICIVNEGANVEKCQKQLKQLGMCIQSYYSDGTSVDLPIFTDAKVTANFAGLGFDAQMMSCPAARNDPHAALGLNLHYVWNPKASGGKWPHWNNSRSPLIWDALPHKHKGKVNVLFGDGHVEEMTPERLKELTR